MSESEQVPAASQLPSRDSSMAMVSLVTGILGLTLLPGLASIVAVVTGYMARKEIRESAGALGGESQTTIGLILGWIGVAISAIGICVFGVVFAIPFCLAASEIGRGIGLLLMQSLPLV